MKRSTLNILIIDDDAVDRKHLVRTLKQSGLSYNSVETMSLEEGIEACYQLDFDCVIIDYQLPGQDGLIGISKLNANFPDIAVIMSTGHGNEMIAAEALKLGALDYIVKQNLRPDQLKKSITRAIEIPLLKKRLQAKEARIEYLAYHDFLTDIPNRRFFHQVLTKEIGQAKRHNRIFAILLLDLDYFKTINDSFGHPIGDLLLQEVGKRLKSSIRGEDMVARLGGDEFVILISRLNQIEDATLCAARLIDVLKRSFTVDGKKINITSSIGIATYPKSGETVSEIMNHADQALYHAKYSGKNRFKLYCDH